MTSEVPEEAAKVDREGKYDLGVGSAVVTGRSLAAQVNVCAMAEIVQAMLTDGCTVLEDEHWLQVQAAKSRLSSNEQAGLEAVHTRLRTAASRVREASTARN